MGRRTDLRPRRYTVCKPIRFKPETWEKLNKIAKGEISMMGTVKKLKTPSELARELIEEGLAKRDLKKDEKDIDNSKGK